MKIILGPLVVSFTLLFICIVAANELDPIKDNKHCECVDYDCGCCTDLQVTHIIEGTLCSNFSYLPQDYGISVTITYKNIAIFNETVSAKNPPPICIIHIDEIKMEICLHFYNLDIKNKCFSGCAEFEISFFKVIPFKKLQLGCFGCKKSTLAPKYENMLEYFRYKTMSKQETREPNLVLI